MIDPPEGTHIGIQFRITVNGAPLLLTDSDMMHLAAIYAGALSPDVLTEWVDTIGPIAPFSSGATLAIQHRPVFLPNDYPDEVDE